MMAHSQQQRRPIRLSLLALIAILHNDIVSAFAPSPFVPASCSPLRAAMMSVDGKSRSLPPSLQNHHGGRITIHPSSSSSSRLLSLRSALHSSLQSDTDDGASISLAQSAQNEMQSLGNKVIMKAAIECGATEPMVDIEWKAERIIVSVDVHGDDNYEDKELEDFGNDSVLYIGDTLDEDFQDIEWDNDDVEGGFDEEDFTEEEFDPEALGLEPTTSSEDSGKIDLTLIARTINQLLAEDGEESPKFTIAKLHEIEVTTPEFDNVLRGRMMFDNYKGFDVTVEHYEDPKKKKKKKKKKGKAQKTDTQNNESEEEVGEEEEKMAEPLKLIVTEGKLVGRDYEKEVTMINVKGRVVKIKNDLIESVSLPKAKREKGVK